jgi:hypothetical protein
LYEVKPLGLEGRFFGGISRDVPNKDSDHTGSSSGQSGSDHGSAKGKGKDGSRRSESSNEEVQAVVGEGMMFQEDRFLTSANLCRWVIDFNEIALGKQVPFLPTFRFSLTNNSEEGGERAVVEKRNIPMYIAHHKRQNHVLRRWDWGRTEWCSAGSGRAWRLR